MIDICKAFLIPTVPILVVLAYNIFNCLKGQINI